MEQLLHTASPPPLIILDLVCQYLVLDCFLRRYQEQHHFLFGLCRPMHFWNFCISETIANYDVMEKKREISAASNSQALQITELIWNWRCQPQNQILKDVTPYCFSLQPLTSLTVSIRLRLLLNEGTACAELSKIIQVLTEVPFSPNDIVQIGDLSPNLDQYFSRTDTQNA